MVKLVPESEKNLRALQNRTGSIVANIESEVIRFQRYGGSFAVVRFEACGSGDGNCRVNASMRSSIERLLRDLAPDILRLSDFWGFSYSHGFVYGLPHTDFAGAAVVATRIRAHPKCAKIEAMLEGKACLSVTCAEATVETESFKELMNACVAPEGCDGADARQTS